MNTQVSREAQMIEKSLGELIYDLHHSAQPNSREWHTVKGALQAKSSLVIAESLDNFTRSNNRLSNRLLWLNIILGIFTIAGTVLSIYALIPKK